jgi:membrane protein YdbS with pleckstrin-like domain
MNKKANTVFFVLGATIVNVIIMMVIFIILFVLFGRFAAPHMSPQINQIIMLVLFIGSIVLTYFIYHRLVNYITTRIDMEKYFDPIFRPKKR